MKKVEANDPFEQRLKPISKDCSKEGIPQAWKIETMGDSRNYL